MESIHGKAPCCSQPARTGSVFTCLPNWVFGQTTAGEKAVLLTLQFHAPNIHPSLATLARESGLSLSSVQRVLSGLEAKGWVAREESATATGARGTNRYRLLIWEMPAEAGGTASEALWPSQSESHGQGDQVPIHTDQVPVQADRGALVTVTNKEEESSKEINPTALEPPLVPPRGEHRPLAVATDPCRDMGGDREEQGWPAEAARDRDGFLINPLAPPPITAAARPAPEPDPPQPVLIQPEVLEATQPQPQQPNRPWPLPAPADPEPIAPVNPKGQKRKAIGFQPGEGDVPAALLPVVRELLAFWACKGGKRTERAWLAQLGQLQRILVDPAGGIDAVRGQLEAGAQAAVFGRAWQAVTHANWQRYGQRTTPIIGTGFSRKPTPEESAAQAVAYIRHRDAMAAAGVAVASLPLLAEVSA